MIQLLALYAIHTSINVPSGYFSVITANVSMKRLRAALLLLPFVFLLGSHKFLAYAVFDGRGDDRVTANSSVAHGPRWADL